MVFSGGEVKVEVGPGMISNHDIYIDANIRNSDDVMALLMITDALRNQGAKSISLTMPYVPYARQDRYMTGTDALSIKVFAGIINAQNYSKVEVWDAHSDVTPALFDRCINVPQYDLMVRWDLGKNPDNTILVSPDAGAEKKIFNFAKELGFQDVIRAGKVRDVTTGQIVSTEVYVPEPGLYQTTKDFLIVDDICDGGRTFIELTKKLRPLTTGKIKLLVTHGIFSKGINVFYGYIDEIYVINNIADAVSSDAVKVTNI
jgi:ribose-phosphate pyrophosphokinase